MCIYISSLIKEEETTFDGCPIFQFGDLSESFNEKNHKFSRAQVFTLLQQTM